MTEDELRKQAKLTEAEIEAITAKALVDNPHWEVDAWGLFAVVAQAQWDKAFSPIQQHTIAEIVRLGVLSHTIGGQANTIDSKNFYTIEIAADHWEAMYKADQ